MILQQCAASIFKKTEENTPLAEDDQLKSSYVQEESHFSASQQPATTKEFESSTKNEEGNYLTLWQIILLNVSYLGLNLMFLILSVEVVPAQIYSLVGSENKASVLGGMVAGGAVITLVAGPFVGMKSDRLNTRFGRRRPFMVGGTFFLIIGLLGMAFTAPNVDIKKLPLSTNDSDTTRNLQCQEDLEWKRCRPYYENVTQGWQLYFADKRKVAFPMANPDMFETNEPSSIAPTGNLAWYIVFYLTVITAYVSVLTPYNALVADRSHHDQRGLNSGIMGGMILLGNLFGAALGMLITPVGVVSVYVMAIVILIMCVCITVGSTPEQPSIQVPGWDHTSSFEAIRRLWIPLADHDFRWVFITRFLMQMGVTSTVGFIQFWIADMVQLPNCWSTFHGVSGLLLPLLICAAVSSVYSGALSDKLQIRKSLVIVASITMAICSAVLAFLRGSLAYYIAIGLASVFGLAFGSYQAIDFALLMDILPDPSEKSRDIAVWHQALTLPQAFAVPIAGIVVDTFERVNCHVGLGYVIMFLMTGTYFLLSGIFVTRVNKSYW